MPHHNDLDVSRSRLGWTWSRLSREAGLPYNRMVRGTLTEGEIERGLQILRRAERALLAELAGASNA